MNQKLVELAKSDDPEIQVRFNRGGSMESDGADTRATRSHLFHA